MPEHARLSPSGAEKWMACPGSVALEANEPDSSNDYSDEGTAAHHLGAVCLLGDRDAVEFIGRRIAVCEGKAYWNPDQPGEASNVFDVDDTMAGHVQAYVDKVREYYLPGVMASIEHRMPIDHITGEEGACGTADAVIVSSPRKELTIVDLKYGMREVDAVRNKQLMIYALAALRAYGAVCDFETVRMVIAQPRLGHYPEWSCSVGELEAFGEQVEFDAFIALNTKEGAGLNPGPHCQKNYCKARATCPALARHVQEAIGADFDNIETAIEVSPAADLLSKQMAAIPLIEDWCKAVRAKVEAKLFAGEPVPGYKLVQGKKGNRKWSNETEAEMIMKGFKLKVEEMYDLKLISPTTAEKLSKAKVIGPRQWPKLAGYITQSEGSPSVAPESDKRPALVITPPADDFEDVTNDYSDIL
jgi:hypothetical protein